MKQIVINKICANKNLMYEEEKNYKEYKKKLWKNVSVDKNLMRKKLWWRKFFKKNLRMNKKIEKRKKILYFDETPKLNLDKTPKLPFLRN